MFRNISMVSFFVLTAGCMNGSTLPNQSSISQGTGGTISFCRPTSIMRIAEAPVLSVNGKDVATVKNNSTGTVPINLNNNYRFRLEPNLFFMCVSEQIAFEGFADTKENRYFIVSGKPNIVQGIAIMTGGIIGAAVTDRQQDTGKSNWEITPVSQSAFLEACG